MIPNDFLMDQNFCANGFSLSLRRHSCKGNPGSFEDPDTEFFLCLMLDEKQELLLAVISLKCGNSSKTCSCISGIWGFGPRNDRFGVSIVLCWEFQKIPEISWTFLELLVWYCRWKKSSNTWYVVYPIIHRVSTLPGGAGFLSSTVWCTVSSY